MPGNRGIQQGILSPQSTGRLFLRHEDNAEEVDLGAEGEHDREREKYLFSAQSPLYCEIKSCV